MKTVVITGASRGIGLATAKKFLAEEWRVIGTSRSGVFSIESANIIPVKLELSDAKSIVKAAKQIAENTKNVDVLVNNAGMILEGHDTEPMIEKTRKVVEVDLIAVIDFTEKILPLINRGGHIINVDSNYGAFSFPIDDASSLGYRLAKAALNMFTRYEAFRLQKEGVIVSSIDPGWVKTDMGWDVADENVKPDREPEQAAEDIYNLAIKKVESGQFWKFGKKREW